MARRRAGAIEVKRVGYYFKERREKSARHFPALSVTKNGIVSQLDTAAKTDDGDNRKKVCRAILSSTVDPTKAPRGLQSFMVPCR